MLDAHAGVFIQMEKGDAVPGDVRRLGKSGQHFKLRGAGGDDHIRGWTRGQGLADELGSILGRALAQVLFVAGEKDFHGDFDFPLALFHLALRVIILVGVTQKGGPTVPTHQFIKNRQQFPAEELAKYEGKYVAWSPNGAAILASDEDPIRLMATVKSLGHDPAEILVASVPPSDLVILGGGGFAE